MNKPEIYLYLYQRFDTTKQQQQTPNTVKSSSKLGFIYLLLVFYAVN